MRLYIILLASFLALCIADPTSALAASFPGSASIEISDTSGGLSWQPAKDAVTVSCWMRMSVPSGETISKNMTVLVDRKTGDEISDYAYLVRYNVSNGNLEYVSHGSSGTAVGTLIERPFLNRWYHIAIVRDGGELRGYVDGREVPIVDLPVGYVGANTDGVSIGGWGGDKYFWGDIQEVVIFQEARTPGDIRDYMFEDLPAASLPTLVGYYKLAYSTNSADSYRNFADPPPTNTTPGVKEGSGEITFEEVDEAGEQSVFDSQKNRGANSIIAVSGGFTWNQTVLSRPTPGVAFALQIGHSSANTFSSSKLGQFDPFEAPVLGKGWQHSFESRIYPLTPPSSEMRLMLWDGSVETWVNTNGTWRPRHHEYRGELEELVNKDIQWTSPDRLVYRFRDPNAAVEREQGRLYEIEDFNGNRLKVQWSSVRRQVTNVVDTAGGAYTFHYNAGNRLTNITFGAWSVDFEYDEENRLVAKSFSGPPEYEADNTRWEFRYNGDGLLDRITDPRSNAMVTVTYDSYGRKTNEVDAIGRSRAFEYGKPTSRQLTMTDPADQKWIETYDRKHHLLSQEDPLGHKTEYAYDYHGNVISITEPLGWQTTYAYDERANKTAETNALGQVTTWAFHGVFNKPVTEVNPLGWTNMWTYDTGGNLIRHEDAIGTLVDYTYTSNGLVETSTDANGNTSSFTYTPEGFLQTKTDPANNSWTYSRNEWGWATTATDPLGDITRFTHDINGNVTKTVDPLWREYVSTFDPNGNLTSTADAKEQVTHYSYDEANQRTQTVDRAGAAWKTTYTTRGAVDTATDPYTNVTQNTYDDANRLIKVTDPLGLFVESEYDANNNQIATIDKLGQRWETKFDRLNRVIAKADPLGNRTTQTYDEVGRIETVTSPNGYPSEHEYDGRGRLSKWTDAEGYEWLYAYDGVANITNITDALGGHYVMEYGPRNERLLELNQDGFEWHYAYDELLRPKIQTDPNGTVRTVYYDDGGRPELVEFSTGRRNTFVYDDNNNPEIATRIDAGITTTTRLQFDEMDRITQCRDTFNKRINLAYDLMGRRQTLEYPDGKTLSYAYDSLSRLTNQVDWASRSMSFTYDEANRLLAKTYPNGITQTNAFDDAGRITDLSFVSASNNPLIALSYAYDKNGNKTDMTEQGTLDWPLPSRIDETARYTSAGRLIDRVDPLNSSNVWTYAYDPSGNMTNANGVAQSFAFTYDEDNRVMTVDWEAELTAKAIQNRYDAGGRRISRTLDSVESRHVLDLTLGMEVILCETDGSGAIQSWHVHGPGGLTYTVDSTNGLTCYHADAQANIIATSDSSTNIVSQYAYTPYGRSLPNSSSDSNPYRYVGAYGVMEELPNLYFMRARYYSAEAGVFLSTDPVKHIGPGWKPMAYWYADGNPFRDVDPRGTYAECSFVGTDYEYEFRSIGGDNPVPGLNPCVVHDCAIDYHERKEKDRSIIAGNSDSALFWGLVLLNVLTDPPTPADVVHDVFEISRASRGLPSKADRYFEGAGPDCSPGGPQGNSTETSMQKGRVKAHSYGEEKNYYQKTTPVAPFSSQPMCIAPKTEGPAQTEQVESSGGNWFTKSKNKAKKAWNGFKSIFSGGGKKKIAPKKSTPKKSSPKKSSPKKSSSKTSGGGGGGFSPILPILVLLGLRKLSFSRVSSSRRSTGGRWIAVLLLACVSLCMSARAASNLVYNCDFSLGNTGFTSDFVHSPSDIGPAGTYAVVTDPHSVHGAAASYGDHTTGSGKMLAANGFASGQQTLWRQTVTVTPSQYYRFGAWLSTWSFGSHPAGPGVRLYVNDTLLLDQAGPVSEGAWSECGALWNSGSATTADLRVDNYNDATRGNDFAMDDISFVLSTNLDVGLVAHYPFNGNAQDSGSGGYDGTLNGAIIAGSDRHGVSGRALSFNGTDSYVSFDNFRSMVNEAAGSVSLWFKRRSGSKMFLFCHQYPVGADDRLYLRSYGDDLLFAFMDSPSSVEAAGLTSNTWQHVATTWENGHYALYVDGSLAGSGNATEIEFGDDTFYLGRAQGGGPRVFDGLLDDVRIYDRALSSNEVALLAGIHTNSPPTDFETVTGTITYSGTQPGVIRIVASTNATSLQPVGVAAIANPGTYMITGLATNQNYWIRAYRDLESNVSNDWWEAQGEYAGNPIFLTNSVTDINITLANFEIVDGDTMATWYEAFYGLDPNSPADSGIHSDEDGLFNFQEFNQLSDPTNVDTDADGLVDGYSGIVTTSAYPTGLDTSGDGYVEGELTIGTDPTDSDTDADLFPDGWEVRYGFDPLISDMHQSLSFSDGSDGDVTVTSGQTEYTDDIRTTVSGSNPAGGTTLAVASTTGFASNDCVMIHTTCDSASSGNLAGIYEFARVSTFGSGVLNLQEALSNEYAASSSRKIQVLKVPEYDEVAVDGTLTCHAWDGTSGGIISFRANSVTVMASGLVTATGKGYRGGGTVPSAGDYQYGIAGESTMYHSASRALDSTSQPDGGGGAGRGADGSGGGGGYGTAGAGGANNHSGSDFGRGAVLFGDATLVRLQMGGGGGGSGSHSSGRVGVAGGNGGGVLHLVANGVYGAGELSNAGSPGSAGIYASSPDSGSGGGGGAGGSMYLAVGQVAETLTVSAVGGNGGGRHPSGTQGHDGGNGGVGRIRIDAPETLELPITSPDVGHRGQTAFYYADSDRDGLTDMEECQYGTSPRTGDTDGDGLPDKWERDNGTQGTVADATGDQDEDGLNNYLEYRIGTHAGNTDTDGDGTGDSAEYVTHGTSPTQADTDGDGIPDGYEISHGLNPTMNDSNADRDFDFVSNIQEYSNSLSASSWQTHSGTNDYAFLNSGQRRQKNVYDRIDRLVGVRYSKGMAIGYKYDGNGNLLRQTYMGLDDDGDGLMDLQEYLNDLSYTKASGNNGASGDADGDDWSNSQELQAGTSPTDPDDHPGATGRAPDHILPITMAFAPDKLVMTSGDLLPGGEDEIIVSSDGVPTVTNEIWIYQQSAAGWQTSSVPVGLFGVTSLRIGQLTTNDTPAIYAGLRTDGGSNVLSRLVKSGSVWTQEVIRTVTGTTHAVKSAYAIDLRGNELLAALDPEDDGDLKLYSLTPSSNVWASTCIDTNAVITGAGGLLAASSNGSPRVARLLSNGDVRMGLNSTPDGAVYSATFNKWFLKSTNSMSWLDAQTYGRSFAGGGLVSLTSSPKNSFVASTFGQGWIGIHDSDNDNNFDEETWEDGSLFGAHDKNWGVGEPNASTTEPYVVMLGDGSWHDVASGPQPALVEVDPSAAGFLVIENALSGLPQDMSIRSSNRMAVARREADGAGNIAVEIEAYGVAPSNAVSILTWTQEGRAGNETGDTCVAFADLQNSGSALLFLTQPDGTVHFWQLDQQPASIRQHLWTPASRHEWSDLTGYNDIGLGEGLAGVCATTNGHDLCIWKPDQVTVLQSFTETPPTTRIMPEPSSGGGYAQVDVRVWDAEGNGSLPVLQYWNTAASNWANAAVSRIDGTAYSMTMSVTAMPTGSTHTLLWNAGADLGASFSGTVKLRARSVDASGWGTWSEDALYALTANNDFDNDSLPDDWEDRHGLSPLSSEGDYGTNGDADHDGVRNFDEYIADTIPTDDTSFLAITGLVAANGGIRVYWQGGEWSTQLLQYATDLNGTGEVWHTIYTNEPKTPVNDSRIDMGATNSANFYRLKAVR